MHWAALIFPVVLPVVAPVAAWAANPDFRPPDFRVERHPVANGAELLTVFSSLPDSAGDIPLVSVLRDALGELLQNSDFGERPCRLISFGEFQECC